MGLACANGPRHPRELVMLDLFRTAAKSSPVFRAGFSRASFRTLWQGLKPRTEAGISRLINTVGGFLKPPAKAGGKDDKSG
jgi:hypothetical protein